jgi:hypothetical protein
MFLFVASVSTPMLERDHRLEHLWSEEFKVYIVLAYIASKEIGEAW